MRDLATLDTLQTVLEHEQAQRDAAMLALRDAQARSAQAEAQAQALGNYRQQTAARWAATQASLTSVQQLRTAQGFLQRLDEAIGQQASICARARAVEGERRMDLLRAERRVAGLIKLLARRRQELHRAAQRREQKATDEAAQRLLAHGGLRTVASESWQGA